MFFNFNYLPRTDCAGINDNFSMKTLVFFLLLVTALDATSQSHAARIREAYSKFESDSQLQHAISSLYVVDAKTGRVVFEKNARVGMAPASTQKIITSVTALELLGPDYRYRTELGYAGQLINGSVKDGLVIRGSGDPTLGSWRYSTTKESEIMNNWTDAVVKAGIRSVGSITTEAARYSLQSIPDGWIWQDIGNYYGAGARGLNWRENQFDLHLSSENEIGGKVSIASTTPAHMAQQAYYIDARAARKGSGDNAYVYFHDGYYYLAGTIPAGERKFTISAAMKEPSKLIEYELTQSLAAKKVTVDAAGGKRVVSDVPFTLLATHYSPPLDSIIFWFNRKSINLYGEALIQSLTPGETGISNTDSGVSRLRNFWAGKGLDKKELNMYDGSGLSPLNRVTTHAQVEILRYARSRSWFPSFFDALPEFNGMKVKSGTISDVKGFCGYHKAADGSEYIFSFLVNNYNGPASGLVNKMYKVMDVLK